MTPSEVRKTIQQEHLDLRDKLSHLEKLIAKKEHSQIEKTFKDFSEKFVKHIENEERILIPALRNTTGWGDVRGDMMKNEHISQRERLKNLTSTIAQQNFNKYSPELEDFIRAIYADIDKEEKDFLNPNVLKDDVITVDVGS